MSAPAPGADPRQALGRLGEEAAAATLAAAGLSVLARRHRRRSGEIDIIAEVGELLVFVEVKARTSLVAGSPAEAITPAKRRRMARVALEYLARAGALERPCRFDVVEVLAEEDGPLAVRHIVDAFRLWPTG